MSDLASEARRLHAAWQEALAHRRHAGSPAADATEQEAFDALVDYCEAHGLNHSEHDPRNLKEN